MNGFAAHLDVSLRAGALRGRLLLLANAVATVAILLCHVPSLARSGLIVLLLLHGMCALRYRRAPRADACRAVSCDARGQWTLTLPDGRTVHAPAVETRWATPWLIVFRLRDGGKRVYEVVILPDEADRDALRRLRVRLRALQSRGA